MQISQRINAVRIIPDMVSLKHELVNSMSVALLGLALGFTAKAADSISIIGEIGTNLGIWVFIAVMVAAFSKSPFWAALNTLFLFLSMLAAYYAYGQIVLGFFPRSYFLGWLIAALLSPVCGVVAWFSRGRGWVSIISAALPVSLLIAEGYPAYYTYQAPLILDLCLAIALLLILPKTRWQRGFTFIVSAIFTGIMVSVNVLSFLPW